MKVDPLFSIIIMKHLRDNQEELMLCWFGFFLFNHFKQTHQLSIHYCHESSTQKNVLITLATITMSKP